MSKPLESLGVRLKRLREAKEWSQGRLAMEAKCQQAQISRWESGVGEPQARNLMALARAYGITLDQLVGFEPAELRPDEETIDALRLDAIGQLVSADERTVRSVLAALKGAKAAAVPRKSKPGADSSSA